jgi:ubiquinone/menaquinone biosynthesis C-methylase UbiE
LNKESEKGHSEEYFSEYRDHWWNDDFLELMATRWGLGEYSSLLDVGCGEFHWSRLLSRYMNSPEITGLDSDPKWSNSELEKYTKYFPKAANVKLISGFADALPFPDNSFDVVTCQTVLIHLADPQKAILEMKRVTKPGGVVICVEPNNMAPFLTIDSVASIHKIDKTLDAAKMYLYQQYGKYLNGDGYNSIGDLVPLYFQQVGLASIRTYLSDKCISLIPPYSTKEQRDTIDSISGWVKRREAAFDSSLTEALVLKSEAVLGDINLDVSEENKKMEEEVEAKLLGNTLYYSGATIMYLVSGKKL